MENFWSTLYIAYDIIIKEVQVERIISYNLYFYYSDTSCFPGIGL